MALFNNFSSDIGIDLGTCNTLVHVKGKGIVLTEPSVVAIDHESKQVVAVGTEAKRMLWKTPHTIEAVRPLRDGVIADFEMTEQMIRHFIMQVAPRRWFVKPRMVIGIPAGATEVEKRAVQESAEQAGAREVFVIEESIAAAVGADLPIMEPAGHMICDIGGGTTEVSVISLGGMVVSNAIRIGGDEFDEAIIKHVRTVHNLVIGLETAEKIKIKIGNADPDQKIVRMEIKGRDAITGLPRRLEVDSIEMCEALQEPTRPDPGGDQAGAGAHAGGVGLRHRGARHRHDRWRLAPARVAAPDRSGDRRAGDRGGATSAVRCARGRQVLRDNRDEPTPAVPVRIMTAPGS